MIRRRVKPANLTPGLTAIAVRRDERITVLVSEAIPARLQRVGGRGALRAARYAGWTRNPIPAALLLFTSTSLWRAAIASGARRFAVAGSAALVLAVAVGTFLVDEVHSPPGPTVITPVSSNSTPHARAGTKRAAQSSRPWQARKTGRARVVAHRRQQEAPTGTARSAPTGATPTAVTSTPTGSSPSPRPSSSSPDPSPSPSPTRTKHCILVFC
ncbi:MAG TPA: hypothetical protein VMA72_20750 [Streptosporangiaceae bacterium]|nr:hypothetical protein [Streptosporangiaceae bacterium]